VAETEQEIKPVEASVPIPLPLGVHGHEVADMFLEGVEKKEFGETGPQKPGTRTVPTQYSLDHYIAQQWNLDVDNMPHSLPENLAIVAKRFNSYIRRGVQQVKIKANPKPTLKKKIGQWASAQLEMQRRQLELLYFRSNCD